MSGALKVLGELELDDLRNRVLGALQSGDDMATRMRVGAPGSILDQFVRQGTMDEDGYTPWLPSQRAIREGNRTLVDTGAYFGGWMGGAGSVTEIAVDGQQLRVAVGVMLDQFPQAEVFQADDVTRFRERELLADGERWGFEVAPRRVSIGRELLQDLGARLLERIVGAAA